MKKIVLLFTLLLLLFSLYAVDPTSDYQSFTQKIAGYILDNEEDYTDDYTYLYVQDFIDPLGSGQSENGYHGINLDYSDDEDTLTYSSASGTNLSYKYMISPTAERLHELGLKISSFTVYVTYAQNQANGARLIISHTPLYWRSPSGAIDSTISVDYELGALYAIDDGEHVSEYHQQMCLSSNSTLTSYEIERRIMIELPNTTGKASIQEAGLFFRMTDGSFPTHTGQYIGDVTLSLEAI